MAAKSTKKDQPDRNPDPITDAPGAHPVGVGIGAAVGGAATGAAVGAATGPIGAAVGAAVGAVAGGYAGKAVAEQIDPTVESAYWEENYPRRPYYDEDVEYDQYAPAYQYGWESRQRYPDQSFDDVESELESGWPMAKSTSELEWQKARQATRDAWDRIEQSAALSRDNTSRKPK